MSQPLCTPGTFCYETERYSCCDGHWKCYCVISALVSTINESKQINLTEDTINQLLEKEYGDSLKAYPIEVNRAIWITTNI